LGSYNTRLPICDAIKDCPGFWTMQFFSLAG